MLFYNHKHEFIGIDEDGLKLLNYATLDELLGVCGDVADLFAKEPGYIHNFKSFGWIDFLLHADSDARSAIVHAHGRTFSCTLSVHNIYLCAEPEQNGYMIDMTHIQSISGDDIKPHTVTPKVQTEFKAPPTAAPTRSFEASADILPDYGHITPTPLTEPGTLDVPSTLDEVEAVPEPIEDLYTKLALPLSDEELHENLPEIEPVAETRTERPMLGDVHYTSAEKEFLSALKVDKTYRFDPNVAAHELGLPVDLIQEFIGDFIQQAYEFKSELFEAALKGDTNNVKILSHKLKGVAANLRIEDAFETLSIINTSSEPIEIEANLKYFYTIIAKLEGKEIIEEDETAPFLKSNMDAVPVAEVSVSEPAATLLDDDIYTFSLKEDAPASVENEKVEENEPVVDDEEIFLKPMGIELSEVDLSPSVESNDEKSASPEFPTPPLHYDKVLISGELGIEHDFFDELIEEYKHDALRAGKEISAAIGAFDTHAWKRTATQLKGISDNLRLNEISDELAILSQTNDAQEANKASKRLNSFIEQL